MALDGITLHFIKDEIAEKLIGARVERVNQPSRLELVFNMRTRNGAYKLLMSAEPSSARVHLTLIRLKTRKNRQCFVCFLEKNLQEQFSEAFVNRALTEYCFLILTQLTK